MQYGYVEQAVANVKAALGTKQLPKPDAGLADVKVAAEKAIAVAKEVVDLTVGAQKRVVPELWLGGKGRKVPSPYLRRLESSPPTAGCPDAAEREGRLWIRHAEKTASPYLRFDRSAVTMIPRPAGERRWTMGPICLGGGQPWRGAVTHRPSTQCARYQPIACLKIIMLASSPLLPGSFQS